MDDIRTGSAGFFQIFFHVLQTALHSPPHCAFVNAFRFSYFRIGLAKNDAGIHTAALDFGQRVKRVPQTDKEFHPFQELLGRGLMQAGRVFDPVLTVKRILRLVPGEPPLIGHLIAGIGLEYLGHLVRNFDKLILRVPIINIFQIDSTKIKLGRVDQPERTNHAPKGKVRIMVHGSRLL